MTRAQRPSVARRSRWHALTALRCAVDKPAGGLARAVQIMMDEQVPGQAEYGQERADVAVALGNAAYLNSGYTVNIPAELLSPGHHTLTLRVVSQDSQSYYQSAP